MAQSELSNHNSSTFDNSRLLTPNIKKMIDRSTRNQYVPYKFSAVKSNNRLPIVKNPNTFILKKQHSSPYQLVPSEMHSKTLIFRPHITNQASDSSLKFQTRNSDLSDTSQNNSFQTRLLIKQTARIKHILMKNKAKKYKLKTLPRNKKIKPIKGETIKRSAMQQIHNKLNQTVDDPTSISSIDNGESISEEKMQNVILLQKREPTDENEESGLCSKIRFSQQMCKLIFRSKSPEKTAIKVELKQNERKISDAKSNASMNAENMIPDKFSSKLWPVRIKRIDEYKKNIEKRNEHLNDIFIKTSHTCKPKINSKMNERINQSKLPNFGRLSQLEERSKSNEVIAQIPIFPILAKTRNLLDNSNALRSPYITSDQIPNKLLSHPYQPLADFKQKSQLIRKLSSEKIDHSSSSDRNGPINMATRKFRTLKSRRNSFQIKKNYYVLPQLNNGPKNNFPIQNKQIFQNENFIENNWDFKPWNLESPRLESELFDTL